MISRQFVANHKLILFCHIDSICTALHFFPSRRRRIIFIITIIISIQSAFSVCAHFTTIFFVHILGWCAFLQLQASIFKMSTQWHECEAAASSVWCVYDAFNQYCSLLNILSSDPSYVCLICCFSCCWLCREKKASSNVKKILSFYLKP